MLAGIQLDEHISEQARIASEVLGVMANIIAQPVSAPWPPSRSRPAA